MGEGFKIADGFVEVHYEPDRASAREAATEVANIVGDESENVGRKRSRGIFAALFTPNPSVLMALRTGIPAVLSSPIGLAALTLGALFASSFIGAIIAALSLGGLGAAFVALGAFALHEVETIKTGFDDMVTNIKSSLATAAEPLIPAFEQAFAIIRHVFVNDIAPLLTEIFTGLAPVIQPLVEAVGDAIVIFLTAIADPAVINPIRDLIIALAPMIPQVAQALGDFFTILAKNAPIIVDAFQIVIDIISRVIVISATVLSFFAFVLIQMKAKWDQLWNGAKQLGQSFWSWLQGVIAAVRNAFSTVVEWIGQRIDNARQRIQNARDAIARAWALLKEKIIQPIREGIDNAIMWVRQLPSRAAAALGNIGSRLFQKGKELVQGFIAGIKSSLGAVGSAVGSILSFLPGSPVKAGPLVVFNQLSTNPGAKLAHMLAEGFNMQMQAFTPALAGISNNVTVNPSIANPPVSVRVMLDGREITPTVYAVIDEQNLQMKRAVTSGGSRLP